MTEKTTTFRKGDVVRLLMPSFSPGDNIYTFERYYNGKLEVSKKWKTMGKKYYLYDEQFIKFVSRSKTAFEEFYDEEF